MRLSRHEYWSGLPFPSPGDLPNPGTEPASPVSPAWAGRFFTTEQPGKLQRAHHRNLVSIHNYTVDLLYPLCPPLNPPSPLVTATLLSMCLFWFDLAYAFYFFSILQWNHTGFVFVWLTSLTFYPQCCYKWQDFIFFYGWVIFYSIHCWPLNNMSWDCVSSLTRRLFSFLILQIVFNSTSHTYSICSLLNQRTWNCRYRGPAYVEGRL